MAVLVEAISVIIKRSAIDAKYPGGFQAFETWALETDPTGLCADDDIVRVGFEAPLDVRRFCEQLGVHGIGSPENPVDLAIIDQVTGAVTPCDWVESAGLNLEGGGRILAARLTDSTDDRIVLPEGWTFEASFTRNKFFSSPPISMEALEYVRTEGPLGVWRHKLTGDERYVATRPDHLQPLAQLDLA